MHFWNRISVSLKRVTAAVITVYVVRQLKTYAPKMKKKFNITQNRLALKEFLIFVWYYRSQTQISWGGGWDCTLCPPPSCTTTHFQNKIEKEVKIAICVHSSSKRHKHIYIDYTYIAYIQTKLPFVFRAYSNVEIMMCVFKSIYD